MASAISYSNLVNFAKFVADKNDDKYNNMYALRGYNLTDLSKYEDFNKSNHTLHNDADNADIVTKKDFDVLLMILSGAIDNDNYNFGADCHIDGAPICSFENPDADSINKKNPRHKIKIKNKNFSKCMYDGKSLNINQDTSSILNNNTLIVEPDEGDPCHKNNITNNMCPDDTHFYWDTQGANWGLAGNLFNYFTDKKAKPGQCVKRYGASPNDENPAKFKSIVDNDPHKVSDGTCMSVGTVMTDSSGNDLRTDLPNTNTGKCDKPGCVINSDSSNEVARECANAGKIYYNGGEYTIPKNEAGSGVLTQNCKIFQTKPRLTPNATQLTQNASRQDILDREDNCEDSKKPHYNEKLDINSDTKNDYDIPADIIDTDNGENKNTWWKNNTCRYVYEIPLKEQTGQTYQNNDIWHPPLFNGECSISNLGNNYALGSNSESNSSDYESIGLFVEEDILKSIKNDSSIEHPFYSSSTLSSEISGNVYSSINRTGASLDTPNTNIAQTACVWLGSDSGTYMNLGNTTEKNNTPPNSIESQKAGNFFKYVKNNDFYQHNKEPNFYKNSVGQEGQHKMIPYGKWRQVDVCDKDDTRFGYQEQKQGKLQFDDTGGKWYNNSNVKQLEIVHENNGNTLYKLGSSGSTFTSNSSGSTFTSNPSGTGSGICLRQIIIDELPEYVRNPNDDTLKFKDTIDVNRVNETHLETQFGQDLHNIYNKIYNEINEEQLTRGNSLYYTIDNELCGVGTDSNNRFTTALNKRGEFNEEHTFNNVRHGSLQLEHAWIAPK